MKHNLEAVSNRQEYETMPEMITLTQEQLDSRIAAAVQAERDNNKLAALSVLGKHLDDMQTARELAIAISLEAVAIRARVK